MRLASLLLALAFSACAVAPEAGDIAGRYRFESGVLSGWQELELAANGSCVLAPCSRWAGSVLRRERAGRWRVEGDRVLIRTGRGGSRVLRMRSWRGAVYLVPPAELEWFEEFGPDYEFCFVPEGADVASPPSYFLPGQDGGDQ